MPNKSVMEVKILGEAGHEFALLGIATNKKKYDRDMTKVAAQLSKAGPGHDKFLEMIHVWIDYTCCRSIHQQIDTYRVGVTKSSESTHHMLIEDVLNTCIDYKAIEEFFNSKGYFINTTKLPGRALPINATALLISKNNNNALTVEDLQSYMEKYLVISDPTITTIDASVIFNEAAAAFEKAFSIDYEAYYNMFEGGSESITKETVDIMVDLAMSLEEDRYGKLHRLKRMLPEGFLQRRIMSLNYKALRNMVAQRFLDPFMHWRMFIQKVLTQVEYPEYFADILEKFGTNIDEIKNHMYKGQPYDYVG
jgi:hypothetical protein